MFTGHLAAVTLERGPLSLPAWGGLATPWRRVVAGYRSSLGISRRPLGVGTTKVSASVHASRDAFPELPQGYAAGDIGHRQPEFYQRYGGRLSGLGVRSCGLPGQLAKAIHVLQRRGLRCGEDAGVWWGLARAGSAGEDHLAVLGGIAGAFGRDFHGPELIRVRGAPHGEVFAAATPGGEGARRD